MFENLKKSLKSLLNFGISPDSGRKSVEKKSIGEPRKAGESAAGKRKRRKRSCKNAGANVAQAVVPVVDVPARKIPTLPDTLRDVPPCEGKLRFLDLPLHKLVQFGIQQAGFDYCTPIQRLTLPALLEKRDLAGKAQTGTGKTAAFLLASFTRLLNNRPEGKRRNGQPRMLVLAPTRELAMQIHKDAEQLGMFCGLNFAVVFGGMDHEKQRRLLDCQLDLLVGTPGRVIDYSRGSSLDLSKVEVLVIDEADRMLDMGFIPDVKRIVSQLPGRGDRQTLMFSATLDDSILRLSSGWLADPVVLESEPEKLVSENIHQTFYSVARDEKLALLLHILNRTEYDRVLIFGNRKDVNLKLQYDLSRYGYRVPVLSGDITQEKRIKILEKFRSGEEKLVIATDVAARGIHVDDISLVINYDLPERAEDYIHRIGRTGRAGHTGISISFLCEYGAYYLPAIEDMLKTRFDSIQPTEDMLVLPAEVAGVKLPRPERRTEHRGARNSSHSFRSRR